MILRSLVALVMLGAPEYKSFDWCSGQWFTVPTVVTRCYVNTSQFPALLGPCLPIPKELQ